MFLCLRIGIRGIVIRLEICINASTYMTCFYTSGIQIQSCFLVPFFQPMLSPRCGWVLVMLVVLVYGALAGRGGAVNTQHIFFLHKNVQRWGLPQRIKNRLGVHDLKWSWPGTISLMGKFCQARWTEDDSSHMWCQLVTVNSCKMLQGLRKILESKMHWQHKCSSCTAFLNYSDSNSLYQESQDGIFRRSIVVLWQPMFTESTHARTLFECSVHMVFYCQFPWNQWCLVWNLWSSLLFEGSHHKYENQVNLVFDKYEWKAWWMLQHVQWSEHDTAIIGIGM